MQLKFNLFRRRLSLKIFLSFFLITTIPAIITLIIGQNLITKAIEHELYLRLTGSMEGYRRQIEFIEQNCLMISTELSKDPEVISFLIKKDFTQLKKIFIKFYKMGIVDVIEIENSDGEVVLRGHNPDISGDLKIEQRIIQKGLTGNSIVNFEKGKTGMAIRAVSPIKYNGQTIGLIMSGASFSEKFVDHIKKLTGMENGVYQEKNKLISTYSGFDEIDANSLRELKQNNIIFLKNIFFNKGTYSAILKPLFQNDNKYWGCLSIALSKADEKKFINYTNNILFGLILTGYIFALIIFIPLAKNIDKSLKKIITGIKGIRLGNFDRKIELSQKDEFGMIAESFNELMIKIALYNNQISKLQDDMIKSAKLTTAGQLAAGLAHEIRNPLSSIKMMVQLISRRHIKIENSSEVQTILKEIDRMNLLIKDLLEYAKPSQLNYTRGNINSIIKNALRIFEHNLNHQKIIVTEKYASDQIIINADINKIKAVLINLIINSVQAMPQGGILKIKTKIKKTNTLVLAVGDTGKGIPKTDIKNIFEPFFTTKIEGTGLGLALSKMIIERHSGKIKIRSFENRGTCFFIYLPVNT